MDDTFLSNCYNDINLGYYKNPNPERMCFALQYSLSHSRLFNENPILILSFIRLAEFYPEAKKLMAQLKPTDELGEKALTQILDPPDEYRGHSFIPEEITGPMDLDICWNEFLVTGSLDPVRKVVSVLDWPDRMGNLFERSLELPDDEHSLNINANEIDELNKKGIVIHHFEDPDNRYLEREGLDIDIIFYREMRSSFVLDMMSTRLSDDLLLYIATKGSGLWSLQAISREHENVQTLCIEESNKPGGPARKMLVEELHVH